MSIFLYGDNVDTDVIIPARYLNDADPSSLAKHCMEDIDPLFAKNVKPGDIIIAGENFGCGSSREHAPIALKACGLSVIVAKSFARIFYRNAINIGMPILECPEAADAVKQGSIVKVDIFTGVVDVDGTEYQAPPIPPFIQSIIDAGGLLSAVAAERKKL